MNLIEFVLFSENTVGVQNEINPVPSSSNIGQNIFLPLSNRQEENVSDVQLLGQGDQRPHPLDLGSRQQAQDDIRRGSGGHQGQLDDVFLSASIHTVVYSGPVQYEKSFY